MFYTYVIRSKKDGKWYTGSTNNLRKRFKEHNNNKVFSTKGRGPFELVYYEACANEQDARMREKYLKSGFGRRYLKNRLKRFLSPTGFSLLELMIVVVIIGLTIGAAVMVGGGTHRKASVKSAARDVASLMRMAHSKALSERIYYNLVLDLSNENCYLERMYSHGSDGIWENIPLTAVDEGNNLTETDNSPAASKRMPGAVDIDNVNGTTSGEVRITFTSKETVVDCHDPYNTPDPYSVFLDDKKTGSIRYLVTVDPDTARVKIYDTWPP